ncbi:MAG: RNA methyltransferase [Methylobacter tundripaludum]|nr:RNA methyltransferase [Methylobacter tundripaludum]
MLSTIKIVLVETTHPGNIGAVARAMKNMKMHNLWLVAPKIFPSADATSRASGADDVLAGATVCRTLQEAIADCQLVIGASARGRTISWPELTPRECAEKILINEPGNGRDGSQQSCGIHTIPGDKVAIVFGRENSGLKNHELDLCHFLLRIPCNSEYSSLNIAAAVQVVCYELFVTSGLAPQEEVFVGDKGEQPLATAEQMELFYTHMAEALTDIGFMHPAKSKSIMRRLRRIYNRVQLDTKELDILRGILRMSQGHKRNTNV